MSFLPEIRGHKNTLKMSTIFLRGQFGIGLLSEGKSAWFIYEFPCSAPRQVRKGRSGKGTPVVKTTIRNKPLTIVTTIMKDQKTLSANYSVAVWH